jgi:hypothetical protein
MTRSGVELADVAVVVTNHPDDPREARIDQTRGRPSEDLTVREGDIVVTAVAGRYAIARITADGESQEFLGSQQGRAEA